MHRRAPLIYLFSPLYFCSVFSIAKLKVKRYKKKKLSRKFISLSFSPFHCGGVGLNWSVSKAAVVEVQKTCSLSNQELWAEGTEQGSLLIPQGHCLLFWAAIAMNYPSYSICADSWAIFKRMLWVCIQGHAKIYMSCSEFREDPSLWFCCVYLFSRWAAIFSLKMVIDKQLRLKLSCELLHCRQTQKAMCICVHVFLCLISICLVLYVCMSIINAQPGVLLSIVWKMLSGMKDIQVWSSAKLCQGLAHSLRKAKWERERVSVSSACLYAVVLVHMLMGS